MSRYSSPRIRLAQVNADLADIGGEVDAAIRGVLASADLVLGNEVAALEREVAAEVGAAGAAAVASGTDALALALRAAGVVQGDRVLTVSLTPVATVAAIVTTGATPEWVDVGDDATMDPASLDEALTSAAGHPAAVVVVHLFGRPADVGAIGQIAARYELPVVEDCAQAMGASVGDRPCGALGKAGALSFYPTKQLAGIGDGGMVVSRDEVLLARVRSLRQYGWDEQRVSREAGVNSRMDDVNAAVLRIRLRHLAGQNERRRAIAKRYRQALESSGLKAVGAEHPGHAFHRFVLFCERRDEVAAHFSSAGIEVATQHLMAAHRHPAYAGIAPTIPLSTTDALASKGLSIPLHPWLTDAQVDTVVSALETVPA